jgi:hypothetical protein
MILPGDFSRGIVPGVQVNFFTWDEIFSRMGVTSPLGQRALEALKAARWGSPGEFLHRMARLEARRVYPFSDRVRFVLM